MSCHTFGTPDSEIHGHICMPNIYRYEGYVFEFHNYCGFIPVHKKTFNQRLTIPTGFWKMTDCFYRLTKKQKQTYLISE